MINNNTVIYKNIIQFYVLTFFNHVTFSFVGNIHSNWVSLEVSLWIKIITVVDILLHSLGLPICSNHEIDILDSINIIEINLKQEQQGVKWVTVNKFCHDFAH